MFIIKWKKLVKENKHKKNVYHKMKRSWSKTVYKIWCSTYKFIAVDEDEDIRILQQLLCIYKDSLYIYIYIVEGSFKLLKKKLLIPNIYIYIYLLNYNLKSLKHLDCLIRRGRSLKDNLVIKLSNTYLL